MADDLNFARPLNTEFPNTDYVIGRRLKRNVEAFFPIVKEDLE